jgi:hypothetical protein
LYSKGRQSSGKSPIQVSKFKSSLEVWVEVLEKPNVNEEELVAPTINTEED